MGPIYQLLPTRRLSPWLSGNQTLQLKKLYELRVLDGFSGKIIEIAYKSPKKRENCPVAMLRWYLHRVVWGDRVPTGPGAVGADGDRQFVPGGLGAAAPHGRKHLRPRRMCHSAESRRTCGGFCSYGKTSEVNSGILMDFDGSL